ncbi:hypothetical protein [Edaphobacter modestus]|nr:hypothetical protein [Edaphobacter modestus]
MSMDEVERAKLGLARALVDGRTVAANIRSEVGSPSGMRKRRENT